MIRIFKLTVLLSLLAVLMVGCKDEDGLELEENIVEENTIKEEDLDMEQFKAPSSGEEVAVLKTNMGDIRIRFFEEVAPKAVENFKTHIKDGYYDGLIFHRVINEFMIQGGDPLGNGMGGESIWGQAFEDEFHQDFRHIRGALSMANAGPNTNGSQFFIVQNKKLSPAVIDYMGQLNFEPEIIEAYKFLGGTPNLDFAHTVFGQVYDGMDVVDKIAELKVDYNDKPLEDVVIEKAIIEIVD